MASFTAIGTISQIMNGRRRALSGLIKTNNMTMNVRSSFHERLNFELSGVSNSRRGAIRQHGTNSISLAVLGSCGMNSRVSCCGLDIDGAGTLGGRPRWRTNVFCTS
ncbi:MAG: hypothetical protein OXI87_22445 [Albidovulum sp.]|nr:hypothetical protein [Albidovulum sp.]MDE0307616.1 hypothetical protein [Albidovulum sp.]MDE0533086.1 hypothetical protein [Albidovulum sp.]